MNIFAVRILVLFFFGIIMKNPDLEIFTMHIVSVLLLKCLIIVLSFLGFGNSMLPNSLLLVANFSEVSICISVLRSVLIC